MLSDYYFYNFLLLGHITILHTKMRPIITDGVAWSVGRMLAFLYKQSSKNGLAN